MAVSRKRSALAALVLTGLLVGAQPGVAESSSGKEASSAARTVAVEPEILSAFQSRYGVSQEAALEQLRLQDLLDTIPINHLDPAMVEVYTSPGRQFFVDYLTTSVAGVPAAVMEQFEEAGMGEYLRITQVPVSDDALRLAQRAVSQVRGATFATRLDSRAGDLIVESRASVSAKVKSDIVAAVDRVAPSVDVRWDPDASLAAPAVGGGLGINGCTAGYVVRNISNGAFGLSTAGHCGNGASYAGQTLNFRAEGFSGSQDVQWYRKDALNWEKTFWTAGGWRPVNATKPHAAMNVNDWVCKQGITTGTTCGPVTDRTYCPPYVPSCNATFVVVDHPTGWAEPGDSGGPVYVNNVAWGLVSGHFIGSDGRGIFMPQEYMKSLGIRVAIN